MQTSPVLTRAGLERVRRDMAQRHPGTEAYQLISSCHPRAGVDLVYTGDGCLLVWCHRCRREVAVLQVSSTTRPPAEGDRDEKEDTP